MNIMNKVTWKCMCQNKRRTMVTIFGVSICVAMISAICILFFSFQKSMMESTKQLEGNYEGAFYLIDEEAFQKMAKDSHFSRTTRVNTFGYTPLKTNGFAIKNNYRTTLEIVSVDFNNIDMVPVHLEKGNFPKTTDEMVISRELINDQGFSYTIGDRITLPIYIQTFENFPEVKYEQVGEKTFTISGIVECDFLQSQDAFFMAFTKYQEGFATESQSLYVDFASKDDVDAQVEELLTKYELTDSSMSLHTILLYMSGNYSNTLFTAIIALCMMLFAIILIGGVSLIYNAFSISLSERSRQLGMLSSIGATRKQKRNSVMFEAFVVGVIAIPLGIITSIIGIWIIFSLFNSSFDNSLNFFLSGLYMEVHPYGILFTVLFTAMILWISAWIPSHHASKISAINAIRQNSDIKISKHSLKSGRLCKKLFGVEGELGLKNMKRQRSRYLATLFSLIICIVIFMCVSYFSNIMSSSNNLVNSSENYDISYLNSGYGINEDGSIHFIKTDEKMLKEMTSLPTVKSSKIYYEDSDLFLGEDMQLTKEAKAFLKNNTDSLKDAEIQTLQLPRIRIQVLEDSLFAKYCKEIHVDVKSFKQDVPSVVLVNKQAAVNFNVYGEYQDVNWLQIKQGDTISFRGFSDVDEGKKASEAQKVQVIKVSDQKPDLYYDEQHVVLLITNMDNLTQLNKRLQANYQNPIAPFLNVEFTSNDPYLLEQQLVTVLEQYDVSGYGINNVAEINTQSQQRELLINVMLYGFLTLIMFICLANIINTFSTSVALRRREFAMIKSVGITSRAFYKMIAFEVLFYGIKAILYGIPIGLFAMFLMNKVMRLSYGMMFEVPFGLYLIMIVVIFLVLSITMFIAIHKIKKDNIVETIRQESI